MSTEHQQYSLDNQAIAIESYAESRGFEIVHTYSDAARSGLVLRHRAGLKQLLQDVVGGAPPYRAILVYDVSRWGRFQDSDEAAHYEFLCKSAGVPVHYCAESFTNDGSLQSLIMKALKRTMAGEYSRELGVKVLAGLQRLARLGFKQGGMPGYGLRRMLLSADRTPKQQLAFGERKSIATDRVILVPGPPDEVRTVKNIYRMLIEERFSICAIAKSLNGAGVKYMDDSRWDDLAIQTILTHPKYMGCHVFNRTSSKLYTPRMKLAESQWVVKPGAFKAIVDSTSFAKAQEILQSRTIRKSNEELLASLRRLLQREGRLSARLIKNSRYTPSPSTYRYRFGSLRCAYELLEYGRPEQFGPIDRRRRIQALRDELLRCIVELFPDEITIVRPGPRWRRRLRLRGGGIVCVRIARPVRTKRRTFRWRIESVPHERAYLTLLARLNDRNDSFLDFHVLPDVNRLKRFHIGLKDPWLERGVKLAELSCFCKVVARVSAAEQH
jgi:DNA invertase Pin-like site-specific DNA recombinase